MNTSKRRRERVLAGLAFLMLIVAWDATLRMDERMSPPRMRMSHAVEVESDPNRNGGLSFARQASIRREASLR
jgi:predicted metal-binding membrane protein